MKKLITHLKHLTYVKTPKETTGDNTLTKTQPKTLSVVRCLTHAKYTNRRDAC